MSLRIDDYNDIRITKVKYFVVYFSYRGRRFFLKEAEDCYESWLQLYEKVPVSDNKFKVEIISSSMYNPSVLSLINLKPNIRGVRDKERYNHNQIDKRSLVLGLMSLGLVEGSSELQDSLNKTKAQVKLNNR